VFHVVNGKHEKMEEFLPFVQVSLEDDEHKAFKKKMHDRHIDGVQAALRVAVLEFTHGVVSASAEPSEEAPDKPMRKSVKREVERSCQEICEAVNRIEEILKKESA